jgi:hypothetical protein
MLLCCGACFAFKCFFWAAAISLMSLSIWNCVSVGEHLYMVNDLTLMCEGPEYRTASILNILFVVVVVIGYFVFFVELVIIDQFSIFNVQSLFLVNQLLKVSLTCHSLQVARIYVFLSSPNQNTWKT